MLVTSETGASVGTRVAVAVEAPTHTEGRHLGDRFHLVDPAVTRDTADSCRHVHVVGEVGEVGKLVDANPAHRPAAGGAVPNRCELLAVLLHELMAVHAGLRGRNVRDGRNLDRGVTVSAIETKFADVQPVAVGDGLNGTVPDVRVPRGKVVPDACDREGRAEAARNGGHDRELVPPTWKDLPQWLGLRGAEGELPWPRVRDGMMQHPCAPKNSSQGNAGMPSIEAGILSHKHGPGSSTPQRRCVVRGEELFDWVIASPASTSSVLRYCFPTTADWRHYATQPDLNVDRSGTSRDVSRQIVAGQAVAVRERSCNRSICLDAGRHICCSFHQHATFSLRVPDASRSHAYRRCPSANSGGVRRDARSSADRGSSAEAVGPRARPLQFALELARRRKVSRADAGWRVRATRRCTALPFVGSRCARKPAWHEGYPPDPAG